MDCPLAILRGKTKTGEVYFWRRCSDEMHDVMMHNPTADDVRFYHLFHKEPKDVERGGLTVALYRRWLKHVNKNYELAEAPKLW